MPRPALPDVIAARGRSGAAGVPSLSASLVHVTDPSVHRLSTGARRRSQQCSARPACRIRPAGGLTAAEALASAVPVVTYGCLPGHGRSNTAALDAEGLVPWIRSRDALAQGLRCAGAAGTTVWADQSPVSSTPRRRPFCLPLIEEESRTAC
jgi:hypothetical protein